MRCEVEVRAGINLILKGNEIMFVKRMVALGMALMFLFAANVTRVEAAPTNTLTPEQIKAIVTDMFNKFAAFDAVGTTNAFAPDGTIEDPVEIGRASCRERV